MKRLGMLLAAGCTLLLMPADGSAANEVMPDAIGSVKSDTGTSFYYDSPTSGGATAMWNAAVVAKNATITLMADWTSSSGTQLVGEGTGAVYEGVIYVPTGCEITIDLNGWNIDRALEVPIENGEVICIQDGGVLNLTDTSGKSGSVTGGSNTGDAGGIMIEDGGSLNLWGGSITGNSCGGSGGGVVLAGAGSKLYVAGGTIKENKSNGSGGGVASVEGTVEIVKGEVTGNTADGSGGGLYLQGGTATLQDCDINANIAGSGGGICTATEAALTFKGNVNIQRNHAVSQENVQSGGGILAMSARPIRMSGTPQITMNTNADGTQSNLMFWLDEGRVYTSRVEDAGLSSAARIGCCFTGGTEKEMVMIPSWSGENVFSADSFAYTVTEKDGNLVLQRSMKSGNLWIYIVLGVGAFVWLQCR